MRKPQQLSLFDTPTINVAADYKAAIHEAARKSGLSREQIADKMNALGSRFGVRLARGNGRALRAETLEKWLNVNDMERVMPIQALPVFCAVVDDHAALAVVARALGLEVIGREDQARLRWARLKLRQRQEASELRQLEKDLG